VREPSLPWLLLPPPPPDMPDPSGVSFFMMVRPTLPAPPDFLDEFEPTLAGTVLWNVGSCVSRRSFSYSTKFSPHTLSLPPQSPPPSKLSLL